MCVSAVWTRFPDGRLEKIADDVLIMRQEGTLVVWRSYLGESFQLKGSIQEIDSLKHTITLLATDESIDQESASSIRDTGPIKFTVSKGGPNEGRVIRNHKHSDHPHKH
jgi:predicted RNA-binding protein